MSKDFLQTERAKQILEGLKKNFTALEEFASTDTPKRTPKDDNLRNVDPKNYRDEAETLSKFHETRINTFRDGALKALKAEIEPVNPQLFNDTISKINSEADAALAKLAPKPVKEQELKDSPIIAGLKEKLFVNNNPLEAPIVDSALSKTMLLMGPMSRSASKEFTDKLKPYVDFSDINKNALANNVSALEQGIGPIIQRAIIRDFGKPIANYGTISPGTNEGYTLDETKLTPERIKAFGHDVSQEVANYSQQLELAKKTFKRCEDNGMKFSPEQKEKIMKQLAPTLNSLGSDHLEKNMDDIAKDLSNKLKDNRSIISRITGRESISSAVLEKITAQISEKEKPKSINASLQVLEEKKREHTMDVPNSHTNSNEDLIKKYRDYNARVQHFAMQNGIMDPAASKAPVDIAKIRLINPKAFDEAVFSQKTQNRSAEEVIHSPKGAQVIDEITHSKAMPEAKKPRIVYLGVNDYQVRKKLEKELQANKKDYQAMDAAQEASAAAAPKPRTGYLGVNDYQVRKKLEKELQANKKDYQAMDAAQEAHESLEVRKPKPLPLTPPPQRDKQAQQTDSIAPPKQTPKPLPKPVIFNHRGSHNDGGHGGH